MNLSLGEIRNVMHQRVDPDTERLRPETSLEAFKTRSFGPGDVAELFHENSKYVPGVMDTVRRSVGEFERPYLRYIQSAIAPDYRGNELIELPDPVDPDGRDVAEILRSRRSVRDFGEEPIGIPTLSGLLFYSVGVTGSIEIGDGESTKSLRAYPSAGALYPVEVYVAVRRCDGLNEGVYYYTPDRHALRVLGVGRGITEALVEPETVSNPGVVVVLTGAFWRSKAKYGPRGYRYTLQESGHVAANLGIVAESIGLCSVPLGGFYDDGLNELLGIDGVDEAAVYAIAAGTAPVEVTDGR